MPPDSARAKAWAIAHERLDLVEPWDKIRQRVAEIDIESDTNEGSQSLPCHRLHRAIVQGREASNQIHLPLRQRRQLREDYPCSLRLPGLKVGD
jgi:hypothetical protein